MKKFSICVPTYEMGGYGYIFLNELFTELKYQTVQDFEIIVSDQSSDVNTLKVCDQHSNELDIKYFRNYYDKGKTAPNVNMAMKYASGEIIKILFQDDFFITYNALEKIQKEFENGAKWTINGWTHTKDGKNFFDAKIPFYSDDVLLGVNSIGNPSNFAILASEKLYMDEEMLFVVDCEFYYQTKQKLGMPSVINEILVCSRYHPVSCVSQPSHYSRLNLEVEYCLKKHQLTRNDFHR